MVHVINIKYVPERLGIVLKILAGDGAPKLIVEAVTVKEYSKQQSRLVAVKEVKKVTSPVALLVICTL